jgi:hypothetical protein
LQHRRAYFWAENFACDPRVISDTLGLTPSDVWVAGGTRLRGGRVASVNSWEIQSQLGDSTAPLDEHIANLLDLVGPRLATLRRTVAPLDTGINCVDYFPEFQGNGFHLSLELLRRLVDLQLSVDFDLYGSPSQDS